MDGNEPAGKSRWLTFALGFAIWTIVGLSFGTRSYLQAQLAGTPLTFRETVPSYLVDFYIWGIVSPVIFKLCRLYPIERGAIISRLFFYLGVGIVFVLGITAITIPAAWYLGLANTTLNPTLGDLYGRLMINPFMIHQGLIAFGGTVIVAHAYEYYRQVQVGRVRASELSAQLAQAQLAALRMQIHPHFLFNTLNSIAALLHKDIEAADRMIARLSDFLRATLKSSDKPVVTLAEEIDFLRTYLEIEKIRFQDRLVVEINVDETALAAHVPNLMLQPLVENAILHGVSRSTAGGRLLINATRNGDRLEVTIEDNGPGLDTNGRSRPESGEAEGIGLVNTRDRLAKFYGNFDFKIANRVDMSGVIVNISVPFLT